MSTNKFYTELQVNELRRALRDIAQWDEDLEDDWEDAGNRAMDALRCFEKVKPIELPSDEEIKKQFDVDEFDPYDLAYLGGAIRMRNLIQGGNK